MPSTSTSVWLLASTQRVPSIMLGALRRGVMARCETGPAVDGLRDAGLEAHLVVRGDEPGLRDFGGVVDGLFVVESGCEGEFLDQG